MTLHQERSPNPSLHCSIALKAVVLMKQSLELFLVPFSYGCFFGEVLETLVFGFGGVAVLNLPRSHGNCRQS